VFFIPQKSVALGVLAVLVETRFGQRAFFCAWELAPVVSRDVSRLLSSVLARRKLCMGNFARVVSRMAPMAHHGSLWPPCVAPAWPPTSSVGVAIHGSDFLRAVVASRCPADLLRQNCLRSLR
jgi:hypothetical protein